MLPKRFILLCCILPVFLIGCSAVEKTKSAKEDEGGVYHVLSDESPSSVIALGTCYTDDEAFKKLGGWFQIAGSHYLKEGFTVEHRICEFPDYGMIYVLAHGAPLEGETIEYVTFSMIYSDKDSYIQTKNVETFQEGGFMSFRTPFMPELKLFMDGFNTEFMPDRIKTRITNFDDGYQNGVSAEGFVPDVDGKDHYLSFKIGFFNNNESLN